MGAALAAASVTFRTRSGTSFHSFSTARQTISSINTGADRRDGEKQRLGLVGLVLGLAAAFALSRSLSRFVFEVSTTDTLSFVSTGAFLTLVVLLSSYLPARRASRIDATVALRAE